MRALSARRIATSALCATFLLCVTAPAALGGDIAREGTRESAPVSDAATLQSQVKQLGTVGTVATPVSELMDSVLKAEPSQLSAAEATRLGDAAKAAIATAATSPATPVGPATPGMTTPNASSAPTAPLAPVRPGAPVPPADPAASAQLLPAAALQDELAELEKAVSSLAAVATSDDVTGKHAAVTTVSQELADVIRALVDGITPGTPPQPPA